jgi:hypothetical protein
MENNIDLTIQNYLNFVGDLLDQAEVAGFTVEQDDELSLLERYPDAENMLEILKKDYL